MGIVSSAHRLPSASTVPLLLAATHSVAADRAMGKLTGGVSWAIERQLY